MTLSCKHLRQEKAELKSQQSHLRCLMNQCQNTPISISLSRARRFKLFTCRMKDLSRDKLNYFQSLHLKATCTKARQETYTMKAKDLKILKTFLLSEWVIKVPWISDQLSTTREWHRLKSLTKIQRGIITTIGKTFSRTDKILKVGCPERSKIVWILFSKGVSIKSTSRANQKCRVFWTKLNI